MTVDGSLSTSEENSTSTAVAAALDEKVVQWVELVRSQSVVSARAERSILRRVARPFQLVETALLVLKRDGANRFLATVLYRMRQRASHR